jgi:ribosomal protein S27AE
MPSPSVSNPLELVAVGRPQCPKCGWHMWPVNFEWDATPDHERWRFDCPRCEYQTVTA